ncbi:MAG: peptidyl-prolyl cis-trans isomerase [Magnetococcales bacterium]|nr:peptidyl-prolyl cis-trans isomerase [Magnetococcales bacterium]NGZ27145.1 peptidyl-prolyl cis-trans isomerase [Magnetococcales bacterium]
MNRRTIIKTLLGWGAVVVLTTTLSLGHADNKKGTSAMVVISTSMGDIKVELFADKAPLSVNNFLAYVESGFYKDTIFHRVIPGFMVQGGGMDENMSQKTTRAPIKNEADNGLKNKRGTLAMARTQIVDSATAQFFINVADNTFLDHGGRDFGYAVFGQVVEGMDIVDKIVNVPRGNKGFHQDVPKSPVFIKDVQLVK